MLRLKGHGFSRFPPRIQGLNGALVARITSPLARRKFALIRPIASASSGPLGYRPEARPVPLRSNRSLSRRNFEVQFEVYLRVVSYARQQVGFFIDNFEDIYGTAKGFANGAMSGV